MVRGMQYLFLAMTVMPTVSCTSDTPLDTQQDAPQAAAVRAMHAVLTKGDYAAFYRDWCHPHLTGRLTAEEFTEGMRSDKGTELIRLCAEVLKAVDENAGREVLIARPQEEEGQYELILMSLKGTDRAERSDRQWHLELQLHDGKWKLMDTD